MRPVSGAGIKKAHLLMDFDRHDETRFLVPLETSRVSSGLNITPNSTMFVVRGATPL
ncbi:MAG: hypothetical protein JO066_12765 [Verrucomicrobia bacterium]|nr:hypothetical protein [Verrucomicrobiota bacterium]